MTYQYPVPRPHENSGTHIVVAWVLTVLTGFYLLPWAIAATRHKQNTATIALLNVLIGWTGVGWIVALVLACLSDSVRPPAIPQYPYGAPQYHAAYPPAQVHPQHNSYAQSPYAQSPYAQSPYYEPPLHPEAAPYGPPPALGASPPALEAGPSQQHAFGLNSTDPYATYPAVEQPMTEGHVDDGRRW